MELQSLLFFHFIHNFQYQPVAQAYVSWRVYSGNYCTKISWCSKDVIKHSVLFIYYLIILQRGWVSSQHAAHSNTFMVPAWRIHKGNGKFNRKRVKWFWAPERGTAFFYVLVTIKVLFAGIFLLASSYFTWKNGSLKYVVNILVILDKIKWSKCVYQQIWLFPCPVICCLKIFSETE